MPGIPHKRVSELLGSWPFKTGKFVPASPSTTLPGTVNSNATILGVLQEPAAGFAVGGMSMFIWVDGVQKSIAWAAGGPFTLDQIIAEINLDAGLTIASKQNGFLVLKSPTSGPTSSLRLQTNANPEIFTLLGLFSEIAVFGGELVQAGHPDPDRQVSMPKQMAVSEGENFRASVFNRMAFSLAVNTERNEGLLSRKRVTTQKTVATHVYSKPAVDDGYQFSGSEPVFVGAAANPDALEDLFVVLDSDGREFTQEEEASTNGTADFTYDEDTKLIQVDVTAGFSFSAADAKGNVYIRPLDLVDNGATETDLNNKLLKIVEFSSASRVFVVPLDPDTGDRVPFDSDIEDADNGTSIANSAVNRTNLTGITDITTVDLTNRIVIDSAAHGFDFITEGVEIGDELVWTGHAAAAGPISNNDTYRVWKVIDKETIEVVASDWGARVLTDDLSTPGSITIRTDGKFSTDPFLEFDPAGALPDDGVDSIRILYLGMSTFRDATDDPTIFSGGRVRYQQESDDTVQKAILAIVGPSASSINSFLFDDSRINLEDLDYRLDEEHHTHDSGGGPGRHSDIHPDHIDMFPEVAGETVTLRAATGETASSVSKLALRDSSGDANFVLYSDGRVVAAQNLTSSSTIVELDPGTASGVGNGAARAFIAGDNSSGPAALLTMQADALGGFPLTFTWDVDANTNELALSIDETGAGASIANVLRVDNQGKISLARSGVGDMMEATDGNLTYTVTTTGSRVTHSHAGPAGLETVFSGADNPSGAAGLTQVSSGGGSASSVGGSLFLLGGSAGAGTDIAGGEARLSAGLATGSSSSTARIMAATAGASGTANRIPETYLECVGSSGTVRILKTLDANNNDIVDVNLLDFDSVTTPPSHADGLLYYNGNRDQLELSDGTTFSRISKLVHSINATEQESPAASTETAFATTVYTIPANTLREGAVIKVSLFGEWLSNTVVRTLRIRLGAFTSDTSFSGQELMVVGSVDNTTENSAQLTAYIRAPGASAPTYGNTIFFTGSPTISASMTQPGSVDTTGDLDLFLTWESASISQTYDLESYVVEIL
jgi:hypothetical protein